MTRVLCALVQLQDVTLTDVTMNLLAWQRHFSQLKSQGIRVDIKRFRQYPFSRNFNEIVRYAIEDQYDYIFQYDADMLGAPETIERLLMHKRECVGALFFARQAPHKAQLWDAKRAEDGYIEHFWDLSKETIKEAVTNNMLLRTDLRAGGFTLFSVKALKQFSYPYVEFKPNRDQPYQVNGIDLDITWKLSQKFGGVFTDCSPDLNVRHITYKMVTANDYR